MLMAVLPTVNAATQGRAGMDVGPIAASVSYSSTTDHQSYAALSSQDPSSIGMTRPAGLWIIDGMYMVSQRIDVTIENFGNTAATSFNVDIEILHDEYSDFILHSQTLNVPSLAPGATTDLTTTWLPDYTGNHTIRITTHLANDVNTNNDVGSRSLTIGNMYDRAEATTSWSLGSNWYQSDEASLSGTYSFHVGGSTSSSNYGNNWDTSLVSPVIDTSDAHPNPTRGSGIGFFYTGEAIDADGFDIDVWDGNTWQRITSTVTASVDTDFSMGSSWLITVNQVGSNSVPWWNIPASHMNSQFKFRINFHSNAAGTSIGYWIEDIVMFYDQKARPSEFSLSASTGQSGHARAGEWAETTVSLTNNGNLSDNVHLSVENLPNGWDYRFQHMTGSMIPDGVGIQLTPGESRNFKLLVQPSEGSPLGSTSVNVRMQSSEPSVSASATASFVVDPDYEAGWVEQDPGFSCSPGNACDFELTLTNEGDGQDTFSLSTNDVLTHDGWTFGLTWDQSTLVTIDSGLTETISITANIPADALPGMRANSAFTATSQADPTKSSTIRANVTASMVSSGHVGVNPEDVPADGWWISPEESITVPFTIWNNASQQDTYAFSFETTGVFGWTVGIPTSSEVVIAPGGYARVLLSFTAPESAQANDPGPIVIPHAVSTQSGMSATESSFAGIRVRQLHDISLILTSTPDIDIVPGEPMGVPFEVENLGNGAENVVFDMTVPFGWNWWVDIDGATITESLSLSTSYDGNSIASGTLWFEAPGNEDPGQIYDLGFSASPIVGVDPTPDDAHNSWEIRTKMTAIPEIDDFTEQEVSVWIGQSIGYDLALRNAGNTFDSSMRARVTVDSNQPGLFVQIHSSRGSGQLNGWIDLPMAAGGEENLYISFETFENYPLGQSVQLSVEIEGGRVTSSDNLQTLTKTITINVDQKRDVSVSANLDPDVRLTAGESHPFQINVTSDSTMPITFTLHSTVPETAILECQPLVQNGSIVLLLPASNPAPQVGTIDCGIILEDSELARTFTFEIIDDQGTVVWQSGVTHLKTKEISQTGSFSLGDNLNLTAISVISGVLFIAFFVAMTIMIRRRRKTLDDYEEYEDEDDEELPNEIVNTSHASVPHVASSPPIGPMPGAPGPMPVAAVPVVHVPEPEPQPSDFTDEQLRASGWNEQQIAELRGTVEPPLNDAFGSLGVAEQHPVQDGLTNNGTQTAIPQFNCIVTGNTLTANDAWWQCPSCGGFAAAAAITGYTHCPSCNTQF
ncbi:MAG: CARDB domain-containing protein [Candidatus Thalassarchaeaceae archaeon]|nr:CARDB domain-containing protein [Candidatus Thalassarchaeaceae archaeon]